MRVTREEIGLVVDGVCETCSQAIQADESVAVLGKPSLTMIALQMGSTALWLLGLIAMSLHAEPVDVPLPLTAEPEPEPRRRRSSKAAP